MFLPRKKTICREKLSLLKFMLTETAAAA